MLFCELKRVFVSAASISNQVDTDQGTARPRLPAIENSDDDAPQVPPSPSLANADVVTQIPRHHHCQCCMWSRFRTGERYIMFHY